MKNLFASKKKTTATIMLLRSLKEKAICQGSPLFSGLTYAFIHSSAPSQQKWGKNKWGSDATGSADASKAGVSGWDAWRKVNQQTRQNENTWKNFNDQANFKGRTRDKATNNHSARIRERVKENKKKRKSKRPHFPWDDDPDERVIEVKLGGRWFYWSFSKWDEFKWRTSRNWTGRKKYPESDASDDESLSIGSASDRMILGLAPNGPLKLDDVKQAFRQCALKWHPDRNSGPSKVIAEENFKRCGAAYRALCDAF